MILWLIFCILLLPFLYVLYRSLFDTDREIQKARSHSSNQSLPALPKPSPLPSHQPPTSRTLMPTLPPIEAMPEALSQTANSAASEPHLGRTPAPYRYIPANFRRTSDRELITVPDLDTQIRQLAELAWQPEPSQRYPDFLLRSSEFNAVHSPVQMIDRLLRHAENTAPGLKVPRTVPRVILEPLPGAGGQFVIDEKNAVSIHVDNRFFEDLVATQAILAHEVCHYILESSGFRYPNTEINERYTDVCMFICGFGTIFLAGYKHELAFSNYRMGHRLGYLSDDEYQIVDRFVLRLRESRVPLQADETWSSSFGQNLIKTKTLDSPQDSTHLQKLQQEFSRLIRDQAACRRLLNHAQQKYPAKSVIEIYELLIEQVKRDRGY